MRRSIRGVTLGCLSALVFAMVSSAAGAAQGRIFVPYAPGGATDALARLIAPRLSAVLGQNYVVENKAGAGGQLGTAALKGAPTDGSVLLFSTEHTVVAIPFMNPKAGYDGLQDFIAISPVARFQLSLTVAPSTGAHSLAEFFKYLRADPAKANYGVPSIGGMTSELGGLISKSLGLPMTSVPYNGSGPVVQAVAADQVSSGITGLGDAMPMIKAGRVNAVAVTGQKRAAALADVPTFQELGIEGANIYGWYGLFAPRGTSTTIAARLNEALNEVLKDPEVRERIEGLTLELAAATLDQAARTLKDSHDFWSRAAAAPGFVRP